MTFYKVVLFGLLFIHSGFILSKNTAPAQSADKSQKKRDPFAAPLKFVAVQCIYRGAAVNDEEQLIFVDWKGEFMMVEPGQELDEEWKVLAANDDELTLIHKNGQKHTVSKSE